MDKVKKTDAEWRGQLSKLAYEVTRQHGTERPYTNDDFPEDAGTFTCTCCGAPLFEQGDKFDAGCGWPSFSQPASAAAIGESTDLRHGMRRTEVHCARCDAHLGHVFPDGPTETGLRYCINGVAIDFAADDGADTKDS